MENINDSRNIVGMAEIYANEDEDIDIDEIEKSIITGDVLKKKEDQVDFAKEYDHELEQLSKQFNLTGFNTKSVGLNDQDDADDIDETINWAPPSHKSSNNFGGLDKFANPSNSSNDNNDDSDEDVPDSREAPDVNRSSVHPSWNSGRPNDSHLKFMTNEERKQQHINRVLGNMERTTEDSGFLQQEEEEDEIARIMEQIDLLKTNLEAEGVDLSRIPEVNAATSKKEAKAVLRILQIKNDRLRYCDMFEEGILAVAYGLESAFDGKKSWFGSQIDLTGWSETVKVKLRRMRYNTSTFVSEIMSGYSVSSGWRILIELLPSLFLYSRDRRMRSNDNLMSDDRYRDAINNLNR